MSTILSNNAVKALSSFSAAGVALRGKTKAAVDALVADGIKPEQLMAPAKDGDRKFYDSVLAAIQSGMAKNVQALLNADPSALNETQKTERRYQMQQRGSLLKDLRKALTRRLASAEKGPAHKWTTAERILKRLEEVKEIIQKAEDPAFEVTKVLAGINQLAKLLK
jgi:hypothetical protein